jgi:hypothetical protein
MIQLIKTKRKHNETYEKRDRLGISASEAQLLKDIEQKLTSLILEKTRYEELNEWTEERQEIASELAEMLTERFLEIVTVDVPAVERRERGSIPKRDIKHFEDVYRHGGPIPFSSQFRFYSGDQLRRLLTAFRVPESVKIRRYVYSGEEILLISLRKLSYPARWVDILKDFPSRDRQQLKCALHWFMDFMIVNWGYLILNNMDWWIPRLSVCAQAICDKLATLPREDSRLFFPSPDEALGFCIAVFIDNTMVAFSRPGGGPIHDGERSDRQIKLIQQVWWTGWKKFHGLKWQTTDLPNGMNFDVFGPATVRHNDNWTLFYSDFVERFRDAQMRILGQTRYKCFGDSAYSDTDVIVTAISKGMAAVREPIEWDYKDLKSVWKICHAYKELKLRQQPIGKMTFLCLLLRNAHCALNGNQTSAYFNCPPPTLEEWVSQGPRAHPLPKTCLWSPQYEPMGRVEDQGDDAFDFDDVAEDGN